METIEKIWGTRTRLLETESVVIDRLEIKKGGFCSVHSHKFKNNLFCLESGNVEIQLYKLCGLPHQDEWTDYKMSYTTLLSIAQPELIESNLFHRFKALKYSVLYEIITNINVMENDINRVLPAGCEE